MRQQSLKLEYAAIVLLFITTIGTFALIKHRNNPKPVPEQAATAQVTTQR
jgi:hypothetical protein